MEVDAGAKPLAAWGSATRTEGVERPTCLKPAALNPIYSFRQRRRRIF